MQRIPSSDVLFATEQRLHGLMLDALAGDEKAYCTFLAATAPHLRAFLRRRMSRWPDHVEDVVQECLLAIHNQRLTYDARLPITSWLYAIAKYKLIDWLRRNSRREALNEPLEDEHELFSNADSNAAEASRDLAKLLELLPERQRAAIVRTKLDGWSVRETAAELQLSEASVKVSVHRGLKLLASKLRKVL